MEKSRQKRLKEIIRWMKRSKKELEVLYKEECAEWLKMPDVDDDSDESNEHMEAMDIIQEFIEMLDVEELERVFDLNNSITS